MSKAILLLGVAGLGISIAMFLDARGKPAPRAAAPQQPINIDVYVSDDEDQVVDYKELYRREKLKNEGRVLADHSYRGDGTPFSKNLYFMKEAYRRSRKAVPVDSAISLAIKLAGEQDEGDLSSLSDEEEDQMQKELS